VYADLGDPFLFDRFVSGATHVALHQKLLTGIWAKSALF
jgi:hypothetical protein